MRKISLIIGMAAAALVQSARADVSVSNKPTQNMDCEAGVCTTTTQKAVLNVGELQHTYLRNRPRI